MYQEPLFGITKLAFSLFPVPTWIVDFVNQYVIVMRCQTYNIAGMHNKYALQQKPYCCKTNMFNCK